MTHKRITYSDHATGRLKERRITRQSVRWLLAEGIRETAETRGGEQRWTVRGYLGKDEARVIFLERADEVHIVTVEWMGDPSSKETD
jgi:hypothetical protein